MGCLYKQFILKYLLLGSITCFVHQRNLANEIQPKQLKNKKTTPKKINNDEQKAKTQYRERQRGKTTNGELQVLRKKGALPSRTLNFFTNKMPHKLWINLNLNIT